METAAFMLAVISQFALRGLYERTGRSFAAGLFGAANDSVWEQMKILFLSYFALSLPEFVFSGVGFLRIFTAKTAAILILVLSYAAFYYTYTGASGYDLRIINICGSVALTACAYLLSCRFAAKGSGRLSVFLSSLFVMLSLLAMFFAFTVFPPQIHLFRDPKSGSYGLIKISDSVTTGADYAKRPDSGIIAVEKQKP